jgi:DNA polymerase delta subunit 1
MSAAVARTPAKRVLAETTNTRRNIQASPRSAKKQKLNGGLSKPSSTPSKALNGNIGSSQPKSQFEEEYLENVTQSISALKRSNAERDQQWRRPPLNDFNENTDALIFQQIEAEEGTLHGGRKTVQLFGVSEVGISHHCPLCNQT